MIKINSSLFSKRHARRVTGAGADFMGTYRGVKWTVLQSGGKYGAWIGLRRAPDGGPMPPLEKLAPTFPTPQAARLRVMAIIDAMKGD